MLRLTPASGASFQTGVKENSFASSRISGYCVTTATREKRSAGTAERARRMRATPSTAAVSLLPPKRRALPAASTTQPGFPSCFK